MGEMYKADPLFAPVAAYAPVPAEFRFDSRVTAGANEASAVCDSVKRLLRFHHFEWDVHFKWAFKFACGVS
jgi:hypothetical protein